MKSFIIFGNINIYIAFPLIGGVFKFIAELLLFKVDSEISDHPFILGINAALGMCLCLFPFLFEKIKSMPENKNNTLIDKNKNVKDPYLESFNKIKYYKYFFMLFAGIFDFLQKFLTFYYLEDIENNFWIFDILFLSLFSFLILKTKLYEHQLFSLISIILLGIVQNIINLKDKHVKLKSIAIISSIEIIYTFNIVLNKYSMNKYFCSPFEISFYEGLFELIMNTILLISTNKDKFSKYYDKLNSKEIRIFILLMFSRLSFNIFGLLTVKYFSPSHVVLLLIIGEISFSFKYENNYKLYLTIIIFCMILFMLLVFTEIIEINCFNLQKYTKKNISERSKTDFPNADDNNIYEKDDSSSEGSRDSLVEVDGYQIELNSKDYNKDEDKDKSKNENVEYEKNENIQNNIID